MYNLTMIIDVRTVQEYEEGFIKGAINIPVDEIDNFDFSSLSEELDLILYCRSGGRAELARAFILHNHNFKSVSNLGGIDDMVNLGYELEI